MHDCNCGCHPALENCGKCCDKWKKCNCECHKDHKILEKVSIQRQIFDIVDRLNEIDNWRKGIKILADQSAKPYKCPVCEATWESMIDRNCKVCEGKGIVWK